MFRNPAIGVFVLLAGLGAPLAGAGEPATDASPIRIEAEKRGVVDMADGRARFTGNVRMMRGELRLNSDEAELHWSGEILEKAVFTGTPARFQQPATADRAAVSGHANEIEYFADSGRILLTGEAVVEEGDRRLEAQRIRYDTRSRRMEAGHQGNGDGRIRITIPADKPKGESTPDDGDSDTGGDTGGKSEEPTENGQ